MVKRALILDEIRQKKPLASLSEEAMLGLLRTTDLVRRRLAEVVEPRGISPQQYNVLRILRGAGKDGLPTLEIASRLVEQAPGITRLLDRLEAKKWIRRERCPEDRRQVLCGITEAGRALLASLDGPVREFDGSILAMLSKAEQRTLVRILDKVRQAAR